MRYSAESTVLPTTAPDLLNWAAAHVEARGFHDGRDGDRFGRDRGVTATRLLTPGILGALDVAGGDGRRSSGRTYDLPALYAAQRLALDTLSDLVAGGAVVHDADWPDEYRHRRYVVHLWGTQGGRTRGEVVEVFREAAGLTERAQAAAARPGRPPTRLPLGSVASVLEWAAAHLEDVGHRPGLESHDPAGFADSSGCTALHALDRAFVAAKPNPADGREAWAAYGEAEAAWRLFVEHITGGPLVNVDDMTGWELARHLRGTVLMWGNEPGRSTADVVAAFRAAVPAGS
ncbi:DUF6197 family protein [Streptomyces rochei]|uniref:DUF6197 family protein n=1 Tax=Streptomyces rochei TaxID=1928 RepID=UPI0033A8EE32